MTAPVCFGCAKLIANSGIERVVVGTTELALWRQPRRSYRLLRECGLEVLVREPRLS